MADNKDELKKSLEKSIEEIKKTIKRIDSASPSDLQEIKGASHTLAAFVDFNKGCN